MVENKSYFSIKDFISFLNLPAGCGTVTERGETHEEIL